MKSYNEIFENTNKVALRQIKIKTIFKSIILGVILSIGLTIVMVRYGNDRDIEAVNHFNFGGKDSWILNFVFFVIGVISYFLIRSTAKSFDKQLRKITKKFAGTVYFDDTIAALKSRFTLTDGFVNGLQKHIQSEKWAGSDFDFVPYDQHLYYTKYADNPMSIAQEEYLLYLTGWESSAKNSFAFYFDKVDSKERLECKIEIQLLSTSNQTI